MSNEYDVDFEQDNAPVPKNKIKSSMRFARFLLLLIMVVSALVLLFSNRDKINIDNFKRLAKKIDLGITSQSKTDDTVIDFDYDSSSVIDVYKDGIVRVTSDNLVVMDSIGTQFQNVLTGFVTPALVTNNRYIMAYDRGGKRLIVTNSFTVLFDKTFEDNIIFATMNENGYIAVITESASYKNKLTVLNSSFNEVYRINSMNRYFLSADLTDDNKYIAVSSLYVKGDKTVSQINYYKLTSEEIVWESEFDDTIAVSVQTKKDGSICGLFEWGVCVLDSKGKEKYRYEFNNKMLQNCNFESSKYNVTAISESLNGNTEIYVFSNKGKKICDITLDSAVQSLDVYGDRFAVMSRDKISVYNMSGKLLSEQPNSSDGTKVLFTDKNSLMVINASSVIYNLLN